MAKKNGGINPVYMYNNKALGTKAVLDFKGNNRANAIQNEVIRAKQNQYVFENWPLKTHCKINILTCRHNQNML